MSKRTANVLASIVAAAGGVHARPAAEAMPFHEMTAIEQTATAVTDVGKVADDASSADDVAEKAEAIDDQLISEADAHESPEANPEGDDPQKGLLDLEGDREEKKQEKADEDLALGDREEVSAGNITAPAPPAGGESAVTGEEQAPGTAPGDEEGSRAAAEADQERAEATARADDESHEQAATEDEERLGRPAEESEPVDETWMDDETWVEEVEDYDDVNDPDID
jgi:hypothetical protein